MKAKFSYKETNRRLEIKNERHSITLEIPEEAFRRYDVAAMLAVLKDFKKPHSDRDSYWFVTSITVGRTQFTGVDTRI